MVYHWLFSNFVEEIIKETAFVGNNIFNINFYYRFLRKKEQLWGDVCADVVENVSVEKT